MSLPNEPIGRTEAYLAAIARQEVQLPPYPIGRTEAYLDEIAKNGGFLAFNENIDVDYEYDSATDANYTVIRIYKKKTDGTNQYPFVYAPNGAGIPVESALDVANRCGWFLTINGGTWSNENNEICGQLVENSVVIQNILPYQEKRRALVIDNNGDLSEAAYNADAETLVQNGAVSVVVGFMAIIKDYEPVSSSEFPDVAHFNQNTQRQIIGQFGNGDYCIVTCEGRDYDHSDGWTIAEAQSICQKIGLKFAYNLDGGGSTETVLNKKQINTIYEGTTGRKVPTLLVFNGGTTFTRPEPLPTALYKITASKTKTVYYVGESLSTADITTQAFYTDGQVNTVQGSYNTSTVDMSTAGNYNITVSYTDGGITKTTTIQITVINTSMTLYGAKGIGLTGKDDTHQLSWRNNNARGGGASTNDYGKEILNAFSDTSFNPKIYTIPIPATATQIDVSLTGATSLRPAITVYKDDLITKETAGWSESNSQTMAITAGEYTQAIVQIKDSSGNTITDEQWVTPELWTISFE